MAGDLAGDLKTSQPEGIVQPAVKCRSAVQCQPARVANEVAVIVDQAHVVQNDTSAEDAVDCGGILELKRDFQDPKPLLQNPESTLDILTG